MRFDPRFPLVVDGTNAEVAFKLFECLLHFGELDIPGPELPGVIAGQIGAQHIATLTPSDLAEFLTVEGEGEGFGGHGFIGRGHLDAQQPIGPSGVFLGRAEFQ